jgi:hypothetical protein
MKTTLETAVGLFDSREQAESAVEELRAAGFGEARIEAAPGRAPEDSGGASGPPTWENGAGLGGLTGAALGGLAAGPAGMAAGALTGLLVGTLIDLGIPEQDARWYSDGAEAGAAVVTAPARGRRAEALEIMRRHGAREPEGNPAPATD